MTRLTDRSLQLCRANAQIEADLTERVDFGRRTARLRWLGNLYDFRQAVLRSLPPEGREIRGATQGYLG
jgi:hypothetical protein